MLDLKDVDRIAQGVTSATLAIAGVRAQSRAGIGSEGEDILEITLVLPNAARTKLQGDKVLDTLVQISRDLQQHHEDRFPVLIWRTEEELAADAGSEG